MKSKALLFPAASFCLTLSATAGTPAYRSAILGDNPLVYYELDETSGTTAANSGSLGAALDATISGSVTLNQTTFAQGGTSFTFGGGVATAAGLPNSLAEWTAEAWVNYSNGSSSNYLSNDQGGWNDDVLIGVGAEANNIPANSVGLVHQGNPGTTRETVSQPISSGQWYHVVITGSESAGEFKLYVDGVLVDTNDSLANGATFNGVDGFGTPNLILGASRTDGLRPYGGLLDEFALYGTVLDATTILAHYNTGSAAAGVPPSITDLSPADDSAGVETTSDLVATFSEPVFLTDNGTVTIRNLTLGSGSDTVINLPDPQVTVSGSTLTINPTTDLDPETNYAVQITGDAIEDADNEAFAGILNDTSWNFTTAALPGLVGQWEFESEAGGITPDSSGNGHDGTLEGNATLTTDAQRGSVLELSGLGVDADGVNIDSTLEIPTLPAGRGVSLAAWIKRNADASAGDVFSYVIGLGSSGNFPIVTLGISDSTGFIRAFIEGDGAGSDQVDVDGDTAVSDGVWTHIAVTFDRQNDEAITYVDGVAQATPTDISAVGDGALDWGNAVIGRRGGFSGADADHFGGLVDDVHYYDKVLTAAEIQALAATASTPYDTWADGFLPTDVSDPTGNGDGDSLTNLLEFAFGTNPTVSDGSSLVWSDPGFTPGTPVVSHSFPGGGGVDFKARFIRRVDHGDPGSVAYALRFSSDLTDWESSSDGPAPSWWVPGSLSVLETDGDYELVEYPYPFMLDNNKKARFFQVEVTEVP